NYIVQFYWSLYNIPENDLVQNELEFVDLMCLNIDLELDSYINNAMEFEKKLCEKLDDKYALLDDDNEDSVNEFKEFKDTIDKIKTKILTEKDDNNINKLKDEIKKVRHDFLVKEKNDKNRDEINNELNHGNTVRE
ncbi:hypothetical protein COBT_003436, partial [Conglomerata obtusa]